MVKKRANPMAWYEDAQKKRQRVWQHNSYMGYARLMYVNALRIHEADSTSPTAKRIAQEIARLANELGLALKERIDP